MRVAACQILTFPDPAQSADKVIEWMGRASQDGVDVVAFPEACLCGYASDPAYWERANPDDFAAAEARVTEAAQRLNLAVILGTVHWEEGLLYNSLLVIDKEGQVRGRYAKTHLAESWPQPGKRLPVYSVAGVPSCFLVCHDIRYPELVRLPAIAGAQVCYFCSCESGLLAEYKLSAYRCMPIARATENDIYLVMANTPADPHDLASPSQSHGNSKIVDPDGNVMCEAGYFEERLVAATIEVDAAKRRFARRAAEDDTILRRWMLDGVQLVQNTGCDPLVGVEEDDR
jgi:omega-amidase